ncbi:hypothetical protein P152DRAFT_150263 [Eremomyces bilateralis CBS 781.70]|uniref:SnoRNA binding protein-like protein n=1 Tax=Eremomyces bilateralis CBS 781.70 TaxID=1392243 RepID=A0A6G1FV82_9PEZI|nr:uncharacterized protein P152DRAFT_150263 [Eremomyces bilateralis CBS 781.70]KAF1809805.1 hypothetical protein P152DRAFT_150263 [Eremomyces bilateralis CBS 781.70]
MAMGGRTRGFCVLLRNLVLAGLLYSTLLGIIYVAEQPRTVTTKLAIPALVEGQRPTGVLKLEEEKVKVQLSSQPTPITFNPHANLFNRPKTAVKPNDAFWGPRPDFDTEADLDLLVEACRGTYTGLEKMRNVFDCLHFLAEEQDQYYTLPAPSTRASAQDPRKAEYLNADGHNNTLKAYPDPSSVTKSTNETLGECPGPIIPYHVYWTGPATWRVEVFIKSYLYTQNLPCSRLWIWIDADRNPNGVEKMLTQDPLFSKFLPFVERGDISLHAWNFPTRIPLPQLDQIKDGVQYYKSPGKPNAKGEIVVADGIIEDAAGQQWLVLTAKQMTFLPQAISDAVRFVILHNHGGLYLDMDVLILRDMRPLLLPKQHDFAERWAAHSHPGDFNTAILSLTANSSLSSYLLYGGVRMGLNFHPRVIGRMAWKDGRDQELKMMETAAFDPIWTEFNWDREGRCTIPCVKDYGAVFKGKDDAIKDEWESYDGSELERIEFPTAHFPELNNRSHLDNSTEVNEEHEETVEQRNGAPALERTTDVNNGSASAPIAMHDWFSITPAEESALRASGAIADYRVEQDKFPPNNRTLENFFKGAWTYHVHNQWMKHPEPSSWISILQDAHNDFFDGSRTNSYGEKWTGPTLLPYYLWPEFA